MSCSPEVMKIFLMFRERRKNYVVIKRGVMKESLRLSIRHFLRNNLHQLSFRLALNFFQKLSVSLHQHNRGTVGL